MPRSVKDSETAYLVVSYPVCNQIVEAAEHGEPDVAVPHSGELRKSLEAADGCIDLLPESRSGSWALFLEILDRLSDLFKDLWPPADLHARLERRSSSLESKSSWESAASG